RVRRGDQIAEAVGRHLDGGGTAWFVTVTLPHEKGDALADSFAEQTGHSQTRPQVSRPPNPAVVRPSVVLALITIPLAIGSHP
uniref:hypothetical protein n=1 Tax=Nocardia gipuzkoensis TaxID=2749991 RepID=UPI0015EE70E6